jgi:curved DNA-binding protein
MSSFHPQNHYDRLQVDSNASSKDLSSAYRRLAKKYHPDVAHSKYITPRAFLSVKESYEILSDPLKRSNYDQQLKRARAYRKRAVQPSQKKATTPPRQQKPSAKAKRVSHDSKLDIHASIKITLEEAILGSSQKLKIELAPARRPPNGTDTVLIKIPQQCPDGHIITIPQKGFFDSAKQTVGHLHLCLKYAPHQRFSLRGNNIYLSVDIYPWDAATGMSYSIKTPGGRAELRISPGTHNWQTFTIMGHGMPDKEGRRGNLLVYPRIKQPTAVTTEQKRRWKALRASYGV